MSKASKEKGVQFYRLTKEEIKQWYRDKLLSTAGYLLAIKKVTKMPGSSLVIPNVLQFCREWEISKSAFYRAVNELRQKGYMDWEATHGIILKETMKVVDFPSEEKEQKEEKCPTDGTVSQERDEKEVSHEQDSDSHERDGVSHERDGDSHKRDDVSHERDGDSHERENRDSKPAPDKNFGSPQIITDPTDPIQTLSEGEKEKFLKFSKKKAVSLPKPPQLTMKWIKTNFEELYSQWLETKNEKENQKTKYNFEAMSEAQHEMFYGQVQVVAKGATELNDDTSLRMFFKDDFYISWLNWARSVREDVCKLLANYSVLQPYVYS
jgi:hypothetical protein